MLVNEIEQKLLSNPLVSKNPDDWERNHHFSDGLYAKEMFLPKGGMAIAHSHTYSHLSILGKGKALVTFDHGSEVLTAPACINVPAGQKHAIEALEDIVWYCIHAEEVALCHGEQH